MLGAGMLGEEMGGVESLSAELSTPTQHRSIKREANVSGGERRGCGREKRRVEDDATGKCLGHESRGGTHTVSVSRSM